MGAFFRSLIFCAVAWGCFAAAVARADNADVVALSASIDRGVRFLLANQNADGSWGHFDPGQAITPAEASRPLTPAATVILQHPDPGGGRTALVTYALSAAGQSPQSPAIARALAFLRKVEW